LGVLRGKKQVIGGVFLERYGLGMLVLRERERDAAFAMFFHLRRL
jgi:hypothetical protein